MSLDADRFEECRECGAVVYNRSWHGQWHREYKRLKETAEDAEMYALDAQEKLGN